MIIYYYTLQLVFFFSFASTKSLSNDLNIKHSSIAGKYLLSNHAVVFKGTSGHQNYIVWRKTCPQARVQQPHGQMVCISWVHDFEPNISAKTCGLYTGFTLVLQPKYFFFKVRIER